MVGVSVNPRTGDSNLGYGIGCGWGYKYTFVINLKGGYPTNMEIPVFLTGLLLLTIGILSIPYKKIIAKLYRFQYINALDEKYSELLALFLSPFWIMLGLFLLNHSIK